MTKTNAAVWPILNIMNAKRMRLLIVLMSLAWVLTGCAPTEQMTVPKNTQEWESMGAADRLRSPDQVVLQYNLARVHNPELPVEQRVASLKLVSRIDENSHLMDETSYANLANLVRDGKCPPELQKEALRFLFASNYRDLGSFATEIIQNPNSDPEMRRLAMEWVRQNPVRNVLAGIVRSWDGETDLTDTEEQSYRDTVRQVSGQQWDEALLEAINSPDFDARGEAMSILAERMDRATLRNRILGLKAKTDAVSAVQYFVEFFGYLPASREEFITAAILYKVRQDMLPDAARLSIDWTKNFGYQFNIRDFHLLSRMSRDPLRSNLKRTQLVLEIGQALKTRKHVPAVLTKDEGPNADSFWLKVDKLTVADLWNIYLLNEMLTRPRVQQSLRIMADGDMADTHSAWGGLVFYQNGQAEAILYPPDHKAGDNDLVYQPTIRLLTDGRDSLCRFVGHFEKMENIDRAGPTELELQRADDDNFYGLTLTRIDKDSFAAHYYTPQGQIISLGKFPLR